MSTVRASDLPSPLLSPASSPFTPQWFPAHFSSIAHLEGPPLLDLPPPSVVSSRHASRSSLAADANAHVNVPQTASSHASETATSILHDVVWHQLPSLFSPRPARRTFARNLDLALRASVSFAVAAVLAVQSWSVEILAVPYLLPVLAAVQIRPTVGSTVAGIDAQGKGVLLAMLVDLVVIAAQVGRLGDTDRIIAVELLLFVTCVFLAYFYAPPLARRFSLALHALLMIEVAVGVSTIYLPLQIMGCFAIAYGICLLLALAPFPRLAKDELLDRYQQALQSISEVFDALVDAYVQTGPIAPLVLSTTAQSQLSGVFKSLTIMRRLQAEAAWEADVFSWPFPASLSLASRLRASPERVEALFWILTNLQHTIASTHFSTYHAVFSHYLAPALRALCSTQATYLRLLSSSEPCDLSVQRVLELRAELDRRIEACWEAFTRARSKVYGYERLNGSAAAKDDAAVTDPTKRRRALDDEMISADDPLAQHKPTSALYHTSREVFARSCFLFYLSRFHLSLTVITDDLAASPSLALTSPTSSVEERTHWQRKWDAIKASLISAVEHPHSCSLFGLHPLADAWSLLTSMRAFGARPTVDPAWLKNSVKMALIVCAASLISVIPPLQRANVLPDSYWAAFTAAILASDTEGAMWQRGVHRLVGTVVGGLWGYIVLLAFPHDWYGSISLLVLWNIPMQFVQASSYAYLGSLAVFTPIVVVFGYSLAGAGLTIERFTLERMLEIIIGVAIALALSSVLWPTSSIRLLRSEMMVSIASFQSSIDNTMNIYNRMAARYEERRVRREARSVHPSLEEHKAAGPPTDPSIAVEADCSLTVGTRSQLAGIMQDIGEEDAMLQALVSSSHSVQMSLSRQARLLGEAIHEPATFFHTFPAEAYQRLASVQRRIWCSILTLEPALRAVLEEQMRHREDGRHARGEEELFDVPLFAHDLQLMMPQMTAVLSQCSAGLQTGRMRSRAEMRLMSSTVQKMEGAFAEAMNGLAQRVREGKTRMMRSQAIVPLAVFLYSASQLTEQVLILEAHVRTLLELERPKGYDD